ncbi:MAG TPA: TIGR04086 family membrane protein [Halanaerobiales bacterium]|nr:TIGR04086 family membrane protein [Halanaerobiales bacterium]
MSERIGIDNRMIFKGVFFGVVVLFIINVVMAVFSNIVFSMSFVTLNKLLIAENILIILFIGLYIARSVEKKGWLNGGLGGLIYMIIIILLGTVNMPISIWYILFFCTGGLIIGSIGGIIGINI